MALPKILHGGRCMVLVDGVVRGSFNSISWGVNYTIQGAPILGRATDAALQYTGVDPVVGTLSGWRSVDHGPHDGLAPSVQEIFTVGYKTLTVFDRVTNREITDIQSVLIGGYQTGLSPRQLAEMSFPFQGLIASDETVTNAESPGAPDLP